MKDLTHGKEWKSIIFFTLPMIAGNLFQQLYNMVDGIVVGRYVGSQAFSAVGSGFSMTFLVIALMMGISGGMSIIISQLFGAKKTDQVKKAISTMYILSVVGGILCAVVGMILVNPLLKYVLNVPAEIFDMASGYLMIMMAGLVCMAPYNVITAILRALGDSKTPLYFLIVATVVNIVLDVYFVASLGWGVNGVAYATVIAQGIAAILSLIYVYAKVPLMRIKGKDWVFDRHIFTQSLRLGLPAGLQQTLMSMGIMAVQRLVNSFGVDTMAAYTAGSRVEQLVAMPMMQLQMTLSTFAGQNIGANQIERVKKGFKLTMGMMIGWAIVGGAILVAFAHGLISVFVPEASGVVYDQGKEYLYVMGTFMFTFCVQGATTGLLRGAGDVLYPTLVTIVSFAVRLFVAYAFAPVFGTIAIWAALPIGWAVGSVIAFVRYKGGKWKTMGLLNRLDHKEAVEVSADL